MKLILDKLTYSILGGLILFTVGNPTTFNLVNDILEGGIIFNNCPTDKGILVHTLIFFLIIFAIMLLFDYFKDPYDKQEYSKFFTKAIICTLLYFFITSQTMYNTSDKIMTCFGLPSIVTNGCGNMMGTILHGILYAILIFFMAL